MTLAFSTHIDGKPTRFMEKIHRGAFWGAPVCDQVAKAIQHPLYDTDNLVGLKPKIHSIREDKRDAWKPGGKIHMVIKNRTKDRFQFAPTIKVSSTQVIEIKYERKGSKTLANVFVDEISQGQVFWFNSQLKVASLAVKNLAYNDGFDTVNEFFEWFSEDFKGKLIHWTNKKY